MAPGEVHDPTELKPEDYRDSEARRELQELAEQQEKIEAE
jgi:hypothetical protein